MNAIFKGTILSPISKNKLLFLKPGYLVISNKGKILELTRSNPRNIYKNFQFYNLSEKLLCPGFIDIHNHLSQLPLIGLSDTNLLIWLNKLVFPHEEKFKSGEIAKQSAEMFFHHLLKNGTTTTSTFVTVHKQATDLAFQSAKESGIRAFIGKVMMDQQVPMNLCEDTQKQLLDSEGLIEKWDGYDEGRLRYVLTPRFAVSCSFSMLKGIGKLARKYNVYVQSHLAESRAEVKLIKELYPDFGSYTDIYYKAGILSQKTIMAHCIYLNEKEIEVLRKTGTKISHCPTANRFLASGIMPYRKLEEKGFTIGLGTDVAGGYSLSMFNEMKEAIETSKMINFINSKKHYKPMTVEEAFYLATLGGAKALSIEQETGSLEKGKSADFLIINYKKLDDYKDNDIFSDPKNILAKIIYCGNKNIVEKVYLRGKKILDINNL
ncbi:MAG: guanine deaminase [Candidatus Cloacimonetes bacterium]|nr:guanine deaminase [Candidatus Cloacimonadota bacterium]MBL7085763.1 guanine deaminase [Candidatus Cloacimonadota bacterium]